MLGVSRASTGGASGFGRDVSTSRAKPSRAVPSSLDPMLSAEDRRRRHGAAPLDKRGADTLARREAWWAFRDLVQAAGDAGVSRRAIATELGVDEGYLDGLMAPGDSRHPSAAHVLGLLISRHVPEAAKRIVMAHLQAVAGLASHVKAGGLAGGLAGGVAVAASPADGAMSVGKDAGELVGAIAAAVDPAGPGGAAITGDEAREIRREAGEAAETCERVGEALGCRVDVTG